MKVVYRGRITYLGLRAIQAILLMQPRIRLGSKCTLADHIQFFFHWYHQVFLCRAALNQIGTQPALILGIGLTQMEDFALVLAVLHEVHLHPFFQPAQVPMDDTPSLWSIDQTTQFGVICKIAEGALQSIICIINEDVKEY